MHRTESAWEMVGAEGEEKFLLSGYNIQLQMTESQRQSLLLTVVYI